MSKLGISTGTIPNDGTGDTLLVGAVKINSNFDEIYSTFGDGTNLTSIGGTWAANSVGVHTLRNVGIGTTNPRFALEVGAVGASGTSLYVNGNARVTGILTVGSSSITLNGSTNILNVGTGVTIYGNSGIVSAKDFFSEGVRVGVITAETIIYEGSTLYNTWQRTDVGIHTLSNVGIGTTDPTSALTVQGDVSVSGVSTFSGDIKTNGSNVVLGLSGGVTDDRITWNTDSAEVYADTNRLYLKSQLANGINIFGTGTIALANYGGTKTYLLATEDGSVELYHNNSKKFETTGAGVTVTGTTFTDQLNVSGVSTLTTTDITGHVSLKATSGSSSLYVLDDNSVTFGNGNDLTIFHNSFDSISRIREDGGTLRIDANPIELQHSGNTKLQTLGAGVTVTGTTFTNQLSVSGVSTFNGGIVNTGGLLIESDNEIELKKKGTNDTLALFTPDSSVELYYDGDKKFETLGAGVTVTGTTFTNQLSVSGVSTFIDDVKISEGSSLDFGSGAGDLHIYRQSGGSSDSIIKYDGSYNFKILSDITTLASSAGSVTWGVFGNNGVELYYGNSKKFETLGAGVTVTGTTFTNQLSVSGVSTFVGSVGIGTTNLEDGYNLTLGASNTGIRTTSLKVYGYADINGLTVKGNSRDYTDNVIITQNPSATFYGNRNVAIGDQSFTTPGSAGENVAIGYYALNVVGNNDGLSTWNGNTAVGAFAGQSVTTTLRNTFIGNNSGKYITTGGENTILGSYDGNQNGLDIRTSSNNVVLSDGAGNIRLYANSSGNIGIGTTNATEKLTVRDGDISVGIDTSTGLILTSPNGTLYRLIVADNGTLSTVSV